MESYGQSSEKVEISPHRRGPGTARGRHGPGGIGPGRGAAPDSQPPMALRAGADQAASGRAEGRGALAAHGGKPAWRGTGNATDGAAAYAFRRLPRPRGCVRSIPKVTTRH